MRSQGAWGRAPVVRPGSRCRRGRAAAGLLAASLAIQVLAWGCGGGKDAAPELPPADESGPQTDPSGLPDPGRDTPVPVDALPGLDSAADPADPGSGLDPDVPGADDAEPGPDPGPDEARDTAVDAAFDVVAGPEAETRFLDDLDESTRSALAAGPLGDPASAPVWDYPEDGTVLPAHLSAPLFQWDRAAIAPICRVYRLVLRGEGFVLTVFTTGTGFQPDALSWQRLANPFGAAIQLELACKAEASREMPLHVAAPRAIRAVDAGLRGAVYYRQIQTNDIRRIEPGDSEPSSLFGLPVTVATCHGCHTTSADGARIAFTVWNDFDPRKGLAATRTPLPEDLTALSPLRWTFMSFHPRGHRVAAISYGRMWLADVTDGLPGGASSLGDVAQATVRGCLVDDACAATGCTPGEDGCLAPAVPSFSPDGSLLVYVARTAKPGCAPCQQPGCTDCQGALDWNYTGGDLMRIPWDEDAGTFGTPTLLWPRGDTPGTATIAYPTWSPDSRWIVAARGPTTARFAPDTVFFRIDPGSGEAVRLERGTPTNGAAGTQAGVQNGYPRFTPFVEGGHYWLLFHSTRPYGAVRKKQLWAMAIDVDAAAGGDPSHPAFHVPGQSLITDNIQGEWARSPCLGRGASCDDSASCCLGLTCDAARDGGRRCQAAAGCSLPAEACDDDSDCCASEPSFVCRATWAGSRRVCQLPMP